MPDTEIKTCDVKAIITMGRHHEADVECGLEEDHEEAEHVTAQQTTARNPQTGKVTKATVIFTWH